MKRDTMNAVSRVGGQWMVVSLGVVLAGCYSVPDVKIGSSANVAGSRAALGTADLTTAETEPLVDEVPEDLDELRETGDVFVAFKTSEIDAQALQVAAGVPGNVMAVKLQDAINTLSDPQADEQVQIDAVDQVIEALTTSNLILLPKPLPTPGGTDVAQAVAEHQQMMNDAINALSGHVDPLGPGTPNSKDAAWEARNFLQIMQEALLVIGEQTAVCDPQNLRDPACELLLQGDEGGVPVDDVFPGFSRQVRSPFYIGQGASQFIQEQVILPGVIGPDECSVVLKEIQGVKAVVRKVVIPIWVEPWYARAMIVGYTTVWVWEFIPAEFLKTISYCNVNGSVVQDVDIVTVLERELSHFWSFLNKDITIHP